VAFARNGCQKLFLADISEPGLERTKSLVLEVSAQAKVILHKVDVTNDASVRGMVDKCGEEFGRIDFACNNAGIAMSNVRSVDITVETFEKVHDVNLKGVSTH
jgi:NAD(P)-dependent dehydrogenase (short-subunit alcohol dehydrogenase family)